MCLFLCFDDKVHNVTIYVRNMIAADFTLQESF
jgi:hypothetical protein